VDGLPRGRDLRSGSGDACRARAEARALAGICPELTSSGRSGHDRDGKVIELGGELEVPEELPSVIENGADGSALSHHEFFYLSRKQLPTETRSSTRIAPSVEAMNPTPVNIRLWMWAGTNSPRISDAHREDPFLGSGGSDSASARGDLPDPASRHLPRVRLRESEDLFPMVMGQRSCAGRGRS